MRRGFALQCFSFDQNLERVLRDLVTDKDRELAETLRQLQEKVRVQLNNTTTAE